jgi:hypothetical protein
MPERGLIDFYLAELRQALRFPPPLQERILDEVHDHLIEGTEREEARGIPAELAQRRAIARFGPPERVAEWFAAEDPANIAASPLVATWFAAEFPANRGDDMWQRFTERARRVVFYAQEEAARWGENYVGTEHMLLGMVREQDSVAGQLLPRLKIQHGHIAAKLTPLMTRGEGNKGQDMQLTSRAKNAIDLAYEEARGLGNDYIGTEHLLLGLVRESEGLAGKVLRELGVTLEQVREELQAMRDGEDPAAPEALRLAWQQVEEARRRLTEAEAIYNALVAATAPDAVPPRVDPPAAEAPAGSEPPAAPPDAAPGDAAAGGAEEPSAGT